MNDETRFIAAVLKELATSTAVILAAAPTRTGQNALMRLLPGRAPNPAEQRALDDKW